MLKREIIFVLFSIFVTLELSTFVWSKAKLPNYLHGCKKNDPNINACFLKLIDVVKSKADSGIPEIGLEPLEPLRVAEIAVVPGSKERDHVIFHDCKIQGAKLLQLRELKIDLHKMEIKVLAVLPHISFDGLFDVDYKFMGQHAKSKGVITGNADGVKGEVTFKMEVKETNGEKYVQVKATNMRVDVKKHRVNLDKLFANENTNKQMMLFLNNPTVKNLSPVKQIMHNVCSDVIVQWFNSILKRIPYDELLQ